MSKKNTDIIRVQKKRLSEMTDEEIDTAKYRSLEARYNSIIDAVGMLEDQNELFRAEIETCYEKMENAQSNVDINKSIVMNLITKQNETKDDFVAEINVLKDKLKKAQEALG